MSIATLTDMTWEEVDALDRERTIAMLPVGAIEAHGPHLPLGTDGIIARAMARAGAERIAGHGWHVLILPPLEYTPAGFAAGFPGTIPVSEEALVSVLSSVAAALATHHIDTLVIANAHFDPANLAALRDATEHIGATTGVTVVFPDVTRKPWALRLTDEFKSGACHAGRYEGSIVLAARPEAVRRDIQAQLPDNPSSLSTAIRRGHATFDAAGGPRAYFGYPSAATAEEGRETIDTLGLILEEATLDAIGTHEGKGKTS